MESNLQSTLAEKMQETMTCLPFANTKAYVNEKQNYRVKYKVSPRQIMNNYLEYFWKSVDPGPLYK